MAVTGLGLVSTEMTARRASVGLTGLPPQAKLATARRIEAAVTGAAPAQSN
jgi:hypothetical protein